MACLPRSFPMPWPTLSSAHSKSSANEEGDILSGIDEALRNGLSNVTVLPLSERTDTGYSVVMSGRSSSDSSDSVTPTPSRAPSPTPFSRHSSSPSETESNSPLLGLGRYPSSREGGWNLRTLVLSSSRRRKRDGRKWRAFKGGLRRIVRHPLFPRQPLTIVRCFLFRISFHVPDHLIRFLLSYCLPFSPFLLHCSCCIS